MVLLACLLPPERADVRGRRHGGDPGVGRRTGGLGGTAQGGRPGAQGAVRTGGREVAGCLGCRYVGRLAQTADQLGDGPLVGLRRTPQGQPVVAKPGLDALEPTGAEESREQVVSLRGVGAEEGLEVALWEQGDLAELV